METDVTIDTLRNEVLRKVGRNVVLFQQLEGLMKGLAAMQGFSGPASALAQAHDESRAKVENHTMGELVGKLKKQLYVAPADVATSTAPAEISEPWFSFTFHIESDATFIDSRSKALSDLVNARNKLIHKLLPRWKVDSIESCKELETYLDEQVVPIRAEIAHFQGMIQAIREHAATTQAFIDSDAGKKTFDVMWLQQSRVVLMLGDISRQQARPDGWTYLSTAGHILKRHAPEEYAALDTRYKCKTLWDLVVAGSYSRCRKNRCPTVVRAICTESVLTGYYSPVKRADGCAPRTTSTQASVDEIYL